MSARIQGLEKIHQYVHDVIDYSSQYGLDGDTGRIASNIVGPPSVYPRNISSKSTFSFRTYGSWWQSCPSTLKSVHSSPKGYRSTDYVDLFFDVPVVPTQLQIFETYNPGSVVRIVACYHNQPSDAPVNVRKLRWSTLWKAETSDENFRRPGTPAYDRFILPPTCLEGEHGSHGFELLPFNSRCHQQERLFGSYRHDDIFSHAYYLAQTFGHQYLGQFRWSQVFQPNLKNVPPYPTDMIRIEFDVSRCGHFGELDAVRLTGWAAVPMSPTASLTSPPSLPNSETVVSVQWPQLTHFQGPREDWPSDVASLIQQFTSLNPSVDAAAFFSRLLRAYPSRFQQAVQKCRSSSLCVSPHAGSSSNLSIEWPYPSSDDSHAQMAIDEDSILTANSTLAVSCSDVNSTSLDVVPHPSPLAITSTEQSLGEVEPLKSSSLNSLVLLSPRAICPSRHLDRCMPWKFDPFAHLPYEILARILDFLDLRSLFRVAQISRQFRVLVDDALSRFTSLNIQAHWSQLTDRGLLSLGKRLGQVDLTTRAALAVLIHRGTDSVAPFLHLLRQDLEERGRRSRPRARARRRLVARVRSWSSSTAAWFGSGGGCVGASSSHAEGEPLSGRLPHHDDVGDCHRRLPEEVAHAAGKWPARQRLRRLDMSWCGNYSLISPIAFRHFLGDACQNLAMLRLSSCKFINDDCVLFIANTCQLLQELDLSSCVGISPAGFLILGRLIHLRWLSVHNTRVDDYGLLVLAGCCQHLRHLDFGACLGVQDADRVLLQLTGNNPHLCSLNLWRCASLTPAGVQHIVRSCADSLEEIDFGWCSGLSAGLDDLPQPPQQDAPVGVNCLLQLVSACHRIKKLFLPGTGLVTAQLLTSIGDHLSASLEQLDISGSSESISFSGLQTLLEKCNRLRLLDISSYASAVEVENDDDNDDGLTCARLMQLRRRFPACTLISSHRSWVDYAGYLGDEVGAVHREEAAGRQHYFNPFRYYVFGDPDGNNDDEGPPALPGIGQLLALPAP